MFHGEEFVIFRTKNEAAYKFLGHINFLYRRFEFIATFRCNTKAQQREHFILNRLGHVSVYSGELLEKRPCKQNHVLDVLAQFQSFVIFRFVFAHDLSSMIPTFYCKSAHGSQFW